MSMERQQRIPIQLSMFEQIGSVIGPAVFGEAGSRSEMCEERQVFTAVEQQRALTQDLIERVVHPSNLNAAYLRVKANKGSAGIDGMSVDELRIWLKSHKGQLIEELTTGTYHSKQIRGVQIGGVRQLGITNGGGPIGPASDPASTGADTGHDVFVGQSRISARAQCAHST